MSHCLVDQKISKEIDNIFNINIKPSDFIKKKDDLNDKINYIFRTVNSLDNSMDVNEQTANANLSAEQKLDHIFKSITEINSNVRNLNSTVEELKNEQTIIKASLNQQIKDVCREMLIAPVNNQHINLSTNSQSANSIESNNPKKRFSASSSSNDENDNNRYFINNDLNSNTKTIGRKGINGLKE